MRWLGGLAYGGGAIIDGIPLKELGKKGERILSVFRLAFQNILRDQKIPQ